MQQYYILSLKWSKWEDRYQWWGPNDSGYMSDLNQAGLYTQEQIDRNPYYYRNQDTYPVPKELAESLYIARVVPTSDQNWKKLNINVTELPPALLTTPKEQGQG